MDAHPPHPSPAGDQLIPQPPRVVMLPLAGRGRRPGGAVPLRRALVADVLNQLAMAAEPCAVVFEALDETGAGRSAQGLPTSPGQSILTIRSAASWPARTAPSK